MIKVCSKSPNSIKLGNVTIPAYGSVQFLWKLID